MCIMQSPYTDIHSHIYTLTHYLKTDNLHVAETSSPLQKLLLCSLLCIPYSGYYSRGKILPLMSKFAIKVSLRGLVREGSGRVIGLGLWLTIEDQWL